MTGVSPPNASLARPPLAIIAGGGNMPFTIADAAASTGRETLIVGIHEEVDEVRLAGYDHVLLRWGEIGRLFDILKRRGIREIVLIGLISKRPDFTSVKLDLGAIRNLPKILSIALGGDESVLSGTIRFFEARGYTIVGAHEIAPEILAGAGVLGRVEPKKQDEIDVALAARAAKTLGALDIGQAAISVNGRVIAVEGAEGTDGLLARAGELKTARRVNWKGRGGVLAKCTRPNQDQRVDLPTIGAETIHRAADIGLSGVAVEAGRVIIADRELLVDTADKAGVFVIGIDPAAIPASHEHDA